MSASFPLQSDIALWQTLRSRRSRRAPLHGLDAVAYRWSQRARHARCGPGHLRRQARAADAAGARLGDLTDAQLDRQITDIRETFARRDHGSTHVQTALGLVREVAHREMGQRPYLVQLIGALGLYHGQIVEMATGEGKTLTAALAAVMLGWLRRPVHIVTVNDYLAERDAAWNRPIFTRCGLDVGAVGGDTPDADRAALYMKPLVYTTQKELVADWLRDELRLGGLRLPVSARWLVDGAGRGGGAARRAGQPWILVPGLHVAIVDEIDAILIDEAVTPLIIAQPRSEDAQAPLYLRARELVTPLRVGRDFDVDRLDRRATLTVAGQRRVEAALTDKEHAIWHAVRRRQELVEQALAAEYCYREGQHYQIVEDQVVIVDEYTGRYMHDRQWQHGLHQSVEAKHGLQVTADRDTLASLSFQRFFRQYPHLCGMTGTAADARPEMETTYGLPVRVVPTHRPVARRALPDLIYVTAADKWLAVVDEITDLHEHGRPVLVGTRSIEASEMLSGLLEEHGLPHQVLNAVHHREEAAIVARAGEPGAITVATNMAGRGTDIKLGPGVAERGGLHVIITERHEARRIDRQLFGRSGRQGDPGSARCILSLEDELALKLAPSTAALLRRIYHHRHGPLPRGIRLLFDHAQRRAQRDAFRRRARVVRHEDDLDRALPR